MRFCLRHTARASLAIMYIIWLIWARSTVLIVPVLIYSYFHVNKADGISRSKKIML